MAPGPVLVLGAAGAIGGHAVRALLREGRQVRALIRPSTDAANLHGLPVELVSGDLRDRASLAAAFRGCGGFVHVAGFYPTGDPSAAAARAAGLAGVRPVFAVALEHGARGVFVSSLSTIPPGAPGPPRPDGRPSPRVGRETDGPPWVGLGPYAAAKSAMEEAALAACAAGLPLAIVNPTLCLGELDRKPTSGRLVVAIALGRLPAYLDGPLNVVYTGDVGLGIARALDRGAPGRRYILGGANTSFTWLARQIAYEAPARPPLVRVPLAVARAGAAFLDVAGRLRGGAARAAVALDLVASSQHFDTSRAIHELGLPEPTPAVETVRRAVRWLREHPRECPR